MNVIDSIEALGDEPLGFIHLGERHVLPHPRHMTVNDILTALYDEMLDEIPLVGATPRETDRLFQAWVARHDLVRFESARRLLFLIDRYRAEIEYDLQVHCHQDLTTLFRTRRWRYLLNLIDHLPRSWYTEAVSNDDEHAEMIARAMAEAQGDGDAKPSTPALRTWTEEVAMLASVLDAIHGLGQTIIGVNGGKPVQPTPTPRPVTAMERAQKLAMHDSRKTRHKALVARLLPHRAAEQD